MSDLRIEAVDGDAVPEQRRHVHNGIVPPAAMPLDEVPERVTRGYRPENAYAGGVPAGRSTVRPPQGEDVVVTVIARVLPGHRRRGDGTALHESGSHTRAGLRRGRAVRPAGGERAVADAATGAFSLVDGRIGRCRTTILSILRELDVRCVTFKLNDCK
jgi:hypothetical protein